MTLKIAETPVTSLNGAAGTIEARITGSADGTQPRAVAIVCHPHPLHQGTMENKVVHTMARAFATAGIPALRFNFRGVGASAGVHDEGVGETDDTLAAADWMLERHPGAALWLAGFSFGGFVALRAALRRPAHGLVTVAPAVQRSGFGTLGPPACPWRVLHGSEDEIVPLAQVTAWLAGLHQAPSLVVVSGAGHFFHGKLQELRAHMMDFIAEVADA